MRELSTEIEIDAPTEVVWDILTDFESYPAWNPFIRHARGEAREGARLEVTIQPPGGRAITFRPRVLKASPRRSLRWLGTVVMSGLFDGEHRFTLDAAGDGRTRFRQAERFTGVLVPVLGWTLNRTLEGFELMNRALKARAEQRHAPRQEEGHEPGHSRGVMSAKNRAAQRL